MSNYNHFIEQRSEEQQIILSAQKLQQSVDIQTRKNRFKKYKKCFIGKEAIQTMINLKLVQNANDAIVFGNALIRLNIIEHVDKTHNFKNSGLLYRFIDGYNASKTNSLPPKIQSILSMDNDTEFDRSLIHLNNEKVKEQTEEEAKTQDDEMRLNSKYKYIVDLEIIEANNLPEIDEDLYTYIYAKVLHKTKKTQRISHNVNIAFGEKFQFVLYEQPEVMSFTLCHEDKKKYKNSTEEEIGDFELPLSILFKGNHPGYKTKLNLQNIESGFIEIELKCREMPNEEDESEDEEEENEDEMRDKEVVLNIEVLNGYGLIDTVLPIRYNPFVIVSALNKEKKTKTIVKDENPKWNDMIQFEFGKGENKPKKILFQVLNERLMPQTAELIGEKYYKIDKDMYSASMKPEVVELEIENKASSRISFKISAKCS